MKKTVGLYNVAFFCSIFQIVISVIFLINNIVNKESIVLWLVLLCSGVSILCGNISVKKANEKNDKREAEPQERD